ncbi:MAG TPA: B12-binding domain-containing protein [Anaerolineales bacterium]|nr:B12-binding domain-containing protein [Anaerolineales bacterium]
MTEEPLYNIGVVTRVTGVPVATLRAWERRYGFPHSSARTAGGHRLYSEKDILLLRAVKGQIDQGISARQAVAAVQRMDAEGRLTLPHPGESPKAELPPLPPASLREQLAGALMRHDLAHADQVMGDMLAFYSPEDLTLNIISPVLNEIGQAWEQGQISVATEHLASNYLRHRMLMWMVTGPAPRPVNPVILACAPGEWHEGSLLMLGVLLRRKGWPVAYLGQNVPFSDLATFVQQIQPSAVVLVAMLEESAKVLAGWPNWIVQINGRPLMAFGGRAFVIQPELQKQVPGFYLGDHILEGVARLEAALA